MGEGRDFPYTRNGAATIRGGKGRARYVKKLKKKREKERNLLLLFTITRIMYKYFHTFTYCGIVELERVRLRFLASILKFALAYCFSLAISSCFAAYSVL